MMIYGDVTMADPCAEKKGYPCFRGWRKNVLEIKALVQLFTPLRSPALRRV